MKFHQLLLVLFLFICGPQVSAADDASLPQNFSLETVARGLGMATGFAFAADDRVFVSTKEGIVRVVQNGDLLETPFLDISNIVNDSGDRGLTDVAVHPDFPNKPYIYLAYVFDPVEISGMTGLAAPDARGRRVSRVTRYTADANANFNKALVGSELHIVGKNSTYENMGSPELTRDEGDVACMDGDEYLADCMPADDYSHLVGSLEFADDGSLYVSNGDGSSVAPVAISMTLRALDVDSLAGKVLRVNPDTGQGYADNPFYNGDLNSNRSKVINYGLRNPYGFTVDNENNTVVMGDTGWEAWEEVDVGYGQNFGWPCYEGGSGSNTVNARYAEVCSSYMQEGHAITPSVYAYEHLQVGGAIAGVDVYKGNTFPEQYKEAIFYSDFVRNEVSYVTRRDGEFYSIETFSPDLGGVSKIRSAANNDMYFLNLFDGTLSRVVYTEPGSGDSTAAPTAKIAADPLFGSLPLLVSFNGLKSVDPVGSGLSYHWDFGDGEESNLASPQHTYRQKGSYQVTLKVTTSVGVEDTANVSIKAGTTQLTIQLLDDLYGSSYAAGDEVIFEAIVQSDEADFDISQADVQWSAYYKEDGKQSVSLQMNHLLRGSFTYPELYNSQLVTLCLNVTTVDDIESEECVELAPLLADVVLKSHPSGLKLSISGQKFKTPHVEPMHVGSDIVVNADENMGFSFLSWSNGLPAEQESTVTTDGLELTATYKIEGGLGLFGVSLAFLLLNMFLRRR